MQRPKGNYEFLENPFGWRVNGKFFAEGDSFFNQDTWGGGYWNGGTLKGTITDVNGEFNNFTPRHPNWKCYLYDYEKGVSCCKATRRWGERYAKYLLAVGGFSNKRKSCLEMIDPFRYQNKVHSNRPSLVHVQRLVKTEEEDFLLIVDSKGIYVADLLTQKHHYDESLDKGYRMVYGLFGQEEKLFDSKKLLNRLEMDWENLRLYFTGNIVNGEVKSTGRDSQGFIALGPFLECLREGKNCPSLGIFYKEEDWPPVEEKKD
jgi:hypothetical protein